MSWLETRSRRAMDLGDLDQEKEMSRAKGENEKVKLRYTLPTSLTTAPILILNEMGTQKAYILQID